MINLSNLKDTLSNYKDTIEQRYSKNNYRTSDITNDMQINDNYLVKKDILLEYNIK